MVNFEDQLHSVILELQDLSPKDWLWEELEQQLNFEDTVSIKISELTLNIPKEDLWSSIEGELSIERKLIPMWWSWVAMLLIVSGIALLFIKNADRNKPSIAQTVSEDGPITIQKKELRPSVESIEVPKTYSNNGTGKKEFSYIPKKQTRPLFELMALASKSPQSVIEKPLPLYLQIQIIELKQEEERPHYREVEIVFEQNLRKRKRREPTELDNLIEKKYLEKMEKGQRLFIEPVFAMKVSDKDPNEEMIKSELFKLE
jgi:hypothetical protein